MLYRGFTYKGQITDCVDGTDGTSFTTPESVRIAEVAAGIGCPVTDVAAFETTMNPYPTATFKIPPPVAPPPLAPVPTAKDAAIAAALTTVAADPSLAPATKTALASLITAVQTQGP